MNKSRIRIDIDLPTAERLFELIYKHIHKRPMDMHIGLAILGMTLSEKIHAHKIVSKINQEDVSSF